MKYLVSLRNKNSSYKQNLRGLDVVIKDKDSFIRIKHTKTMPKILERIKKEEFHNPPDTREGIC